MSASRLHQPITRSEYDALDGMNWSLLKHAITSPSKLLSEMTRERKPSDRMALGSAIHCYVLEGIDAFARQYALMPKIDRRTKAGKEAYEKFVSHSQGKTIIKRSDLEIIEGVSRSVHMHPSYAEALTTGWAEAALQWDCPESGMKCKALLDFLPFKSHPNAAIVDLKTTRDASPSGFCREIAKYMYHGQAAYYREGLSIHEGLPKRDVILIAVEIEPPFCVGFYRLSSEALDSGYRLFQTAIDRWLGAVETEDFEPFYTDGIEELSIPSWAMNAENANVSS